MDQQGLTWHMSQTGKWHAYRGEQSVCGLASVEAALEHWPAADGVPTGAKCYWCRKDLGMPTRPTTAVRPPRHQQFVPPEVNRRKLEFENAAAMEVEFIGGEFDGMRLFVKVVRNGPRDIRLLEMAYNCRPTGSPSLPIQRAGGQ